MIRGKPVTNLAIQTYTYSAQSPLLLLNSYILRGGGGSLSDAHLHVPRFNP
jgi:hypothetical protein